MSMKQSNLKSFIEELIKEVETELDEANVTGNIDGYQTPHAFSRKSDTARRKKTATQFGYKLVDNDVNNIDEGVWTPEQKRQVELLDSQFREYLSKKGIEPTTIEASRAWKSLGFQDKMRKIFPKSKYESVSESELKGYLAADVVDDIVKSIGSKFVSGQIKNTPNRNYIYLKLTDIKFGSGVVKMLKSQFGIDAKVDYFGGKGKIGSIPSVVFPSNKVISEGKVKRPVNRWLELKNDESMHANKKLAVGLKELKYQLAEVEKFFTWYNKIKTMNELDSSDYWKRTNTHIYKIKERILNIAKTIQEIEK